MAQTDGSRARQGSEARDHAIELRFVDSAGRELAELNARRITITLGEDGKLSLSDPSPLRDLRQSQRDRILMGILEQRWLRGNLQAASEYMRQRRWSLEMARGKAAQQVKHEHSGVVTVVNDLGRQPVLDVTPGAAGRRAAAAKKTAALEKTAGGDGTPASSGSPSESLL